VSKETYYGVKRDLLGCQKRPTTYVDRAKQTDLSVNVTLRHDFIGAGRNGGNRCNDMGATAATTWHAASSLSLAAQTRPGPAGSGRKGLRRPPLKRFASIAAPTSATDTGVSAGMHVYLGPHSRGVADDDA